MATAWQASWTATWWRSRSPYVQSSGMPWVLMCLAFSMSAHVMVSRPSRMAMISASLTMSLMMAPVAYGEITASRSIWAGGQLVLDLVQVAVVGAAAAVDVRVADLVDAVEAAGPQQGVVEHVRPVGGHDVEDPVLRRRLRLHAQERPHAAAEEPAGLAGGPDISVSRACRAPMPPPMPMPPMMMPRFSGFWSSPSMPAVEARRLQAVPDDGQRVVVHVVRRRCSCAARRATRAPAGCRTGRPGRSSPGCRGRRPRRRTPRRRRCAAPACAACGTAT